jgi:hypothetical protein
MPRLAEPIRKRSAIFIRRVTSDGREQFTREPYNVVSLDYGDGSAVNTYVELCTQTFRSPSERSEVYEELRVYDSPPFPLTRVGYGAPGQ